MQPFRLEQGHAKEVPFALAVTVNSVCTGTLTPIVELSGFTLPSDAGPADEKDDILFNPSTAATAMTLSPSDGQIIRFQMLVLSFPALFTTSIPFEAAISAALVTNAVFTVKIRIFYS